MELTLLDLDKREISVHDQNSQVERLSHETELAVHIDDPLNEECSAGVLNLRLDLD